MSERVSVEVSDEFVLGMSSGVRRGCGEVGGDMSGTPSGRSPARKKCCLR